jgi:hypothetical protein
MSFTTYTIAEFLESKTTLQERISALDVLIDKLILSTAEAVEGMNPSVSEYQLDDGQVKIKTSYRNIDDVLAGVKALEQMKQMYVSRLCGRVVVLRNSQIFKR